MATSLTIFLERVAASGLVAERMLGEVRERFINDEHDAEEAALWLVRQRKLTRYQAAALYHGKGYLRLGNYLVEEQLGKGGMGQVFVARHIKLQRIDAIKVLPREMTLSDSAVTRFRREAQTAAKLSHPNIVQAYDVDEANGVHFLVMEYVPGEDLEAMARRQELSVEECVSYFKQAAAGLAYAHDSGIVHRDIKPANLLAAVDGTLKVLDMGLARVTKRDADASVHGLTKVGQIMGTAEYMAPEQADDIRSADSLSDIYSLGCTMFRVLGGRVPYQAESFVDTLIAHRTDPIPSISQFREVPSELDWLCQKMMAKKPEDRPQSMHDVLAILNRMDVEAPTSSSVITSSQQDTTLKDFLNTVTFSSESSTGSAKREVASQRRGVGQSWWFIVLAVLAITTLVAVSYILTRSGDQTDPRETANKKKGETEDNGPRKKQSSAADTERKDKNLNRRVAEWILKNNGRVTVEFENRSKQVVMKAPIPRQPFEIKEIFVLRPPEHFDGTLIDELPNLKQLEVVSFVQAPFTDANLAAIAKIPQLNRLVLHEVYFTREGLVRLQDVPNLEHLTLQGRGVTDESLEVISRLRQLKVLRVGMSDISDEGLQKYLDFPRLEHLAINTSAVTNRCIDAVLRHKSLKRLDIRFTGINAEGVASLQSLEGLRELYLRGCPLGDEVVPSLLAMSRLELLELGETGMTDDGVKQLGGLRHLRTLDLTESSVSGDCLEAFPRLESLTLLDSEIKSGCLRHLLAMKQLQSLNIQYTRLTQRDVTEIRRALPNVELTGKGINRDLSTDWLQGTSKLTLRVRGAVEEREKLPLPSEPFDLIGIRYEGTNLNLAVLCKRIKRLPDLESLFFLSSSFQDERMEEVCKSPKLRNLGLNNASVTDAGLKYLKQVPGLRTFSVSGSPLTDKGMATLAVLTDLEELRIYYAATGNTGIQKLRTLKNLKYFLLHGLDIDDEALAFISEFKSLQTLSLHRAKVTGKVFQDLQPLSQLTILQVTNCQIASKALEPLPKLESLRYLYLKNTSVDDQAVPILKQLDRLVSLGLAGTRVSEHGLTQLRAALPDTTILPKP